MFVNNVDTVCNVTIMVHFAAYMCFGLIKSQNVQLKCMYNFLSGNHLRALVADNMYIVYTIRYMPGILYIHIHGLSQPALLAYNYIPLIYSYIVQSL